MGKRGSKEGFVWTSYSDLSTGLMMSFILIMLFYINQYADQEQVNKDAEQVRASRDSIARVRKNFKEITQEMETKSVKACDGAIFKVLDKSMVIRVTFSNSGWFETGKDQLNERAKDCLSTFGELLLSKTYNLDQNLKKHISQIVVEGHTNSLPIKGEADAFLANLDLSQRRALSSVTYILESTKSLDRKIGKEFTEWKKKKLSASGRSFAEIILLENGQEDEELSKRVEFKVLIDHALES